MPTAARFRCQIREAETGRRPAVPAAQLDLARVRAHTARTASRPGTAPPPSAAPPETTGLDVMDQRQAPRGVGALSATARLRSQGTAADAAAGHWQETAGLAFPSRAGAQSPSDRAK